MNTPVNFNLPLAILQSGLVNGLRESFPPWSVFDVGSVTGVDYDP